MTIREFVRRRYFLTLRIAGLLIGSVFLSGLVLRIPISTSIGNVLGVLWVAAFLATILFGSFGIRCPACNGNLGAVARRVA